MKMTPKKFIRAKLSGKKTAEGFLAAHMQWLRSHPFLSPLLDAYEARSLLPSSALEACKEAMLSHLIVSQVEEGTKKLELAQLKDSSPKADSPYVITIYVDIGDGPAIGVNTYKVLRKDENRNDVWVKEGEEMIYGAEQYQQAERIADKKLFEREDGLFAEIINTNDSPITTRIYRADAMARVLRSKKGPASRTTKKTSAPLKNLPRMKNDRAHFSGC